MAATLNPYAPVYVPNSLFSPLEYYYSPPPTPGSYLPSPMQLCVHQTPFETTIMYYSAPPPLAQPQFFYYVSPHVLHPYPNMKQLLSFMEVIPEPRTSPPLLLPYRDGSWEPENTPPPLSEEDEADVHVGRELVDPDRRPEIPPLGSGRGPLHGSHKKQKARRAFNWLSSKRAPRLRIQTFNVSLPPTEDFEFKDEEDEAGTKTTVMIKNLPNKFTKDQMLELLDEHCRLENQKLHVGEATMSEFDFLYLPMDFGSGNNLGYAFVNFTTASAARRLHRHLQHKRWLSFNSRKVCAVTYARVQGLSALKMHFKNSTFVCESQDYLPVYYTPARNGYRKTESYYIGKKVAISKASTTVFV